ncbi:MAG: ATP synthase F1 subunit delta [Planctomycetota bacterium]
MIDGAVTSRYADALYNLAARKGVLEAVQRDVERLSQELATPAGRAIVLNPRADAQKKRAHLAGVVGAFHPLTQNFVNLVLDKRREDVLARVGLAFRRRVLDERGAVEGFVDSARPLAPADVASIATALGGRMKKELLLTNRIVPELVGGARVIAANRMIDFSVQGRLEALRRRMLEAPLPTTR